MTNSHRSSDAKDVNVESDLFGRADEVGASNRRDIK